MPETERSQPALIGGLLIGVLSVLPLVQAANFCCCLWAWVGGVTTAKLYIDRSAQRVSWAEAARVASIAGLLGAVIRVFIGTPIELATFPASLRAMEEVAKSLADPQKQQLLEMVSKLQELSTAQALFQFLLPASILGALILFAFTVLGGLLGVALYEKRPAAPGPVGGSSEGSAEGAETYGKNTDDDQ
ncbi:MAG: hypothetical protein HY011_05725 [Acidobacteria bacterium]|nr:hypothetical protein [Acidobacteriota bacterium]